jgi:molybdopterin synthase catalytic subunit
LGRRDASAEAGGLGQVTYDDPVLAPAEGDDWLGLTSEPLATERALAWVDRPSCGAVACFVGVVRDNAEGHTGVTEIDYQAYSSQVLPRFEAMAAMARGRWPEVGRLVAWHRVGRLVLGEASVVVVVSTPHRAESFEACRYLIDTLKATAPIWKHETWEGGTDWSLAAHPIEPPPGATQP